MLLGQPLRKRISQTWAYVLYRFIAVWVIVALCASYGEVGVIVSLGIAAINICISGATSGINLVIQGQSNQDWRDRLTNRMFYQLFWEALKSEDRAYLDVDQLFKEAEEKAAADIKKNDDWSRENSGFLDKTAWHWFGGVLHFINLLFWDLVNYGSAIWVGSQTARPF